MASRGVPVTVTALAASPRSRVFAAFDAELVDAGQDPRDTGNQQATQQESDGQSLQGGRVGLESQVGDADDEQAPGRVARRNRDTRETNLS